LWRRRQARTAASIFIAACPATAVDAGYGREDVSAARLALGGHQ